MIKVLQNWEEIGRAAKFIERKGLPRHGSTEKCWDYFQLYELIKDRQRSAPVLDMGCSGVHTLAFLHRMGFRDLAGLDLHITLLDRLLQTGRMWRERTWRRPFRLYRGDLTKTSFGILSFDLITCISVIEHGVDHRAFLHEASRLLRPAGLLFLTADYWEASLHMADASHPYDLPWGILCRQDVIKLLECASQEGFQLYTPGDIPSCGDKCIAWNKKEYTFINIAWVKAEGSYSSARLWPVI